jgi:hypothetical protein
MSATILQEFAQPRNRKKTQILREKRNYCKTAPGHAVYSKQPITNANAFHCPIVPSSDSTLFDFRRHFP